MPLPQFHVINADDAVIQPIEHQDQREQANLSAAANPQFGNEEM